ncbi:uncharacterized protein LOC117981299 [Pan paniscus]|uniref:uncharacterized protein LOC117981299 n=1 Tax=Pan paniscus TaxID=9597 RepID=UPI003006A432
MTTVQQHPRLEQKDRGLLEEGSSREMELKDSSLLDLTVENCMARLLQGLGRIRDKSADNRLNDSIHPTLAAAPSPTLAGDLHPLSTSDRVSLLGVPSSSRLGGCVGVNKVQPPTPLGRLGISRQDLNSPRGNKDHKLSGSRGLGGGPPGAGVSSLTRHGRWRLLPRSAREAEDSRGRRRIPAERRERRAGGSPCGEGLQAASRSGLRGNPRSSLFPEDPRERPGRGAPSAPVTRCAKFKRTQWVLSGVTDSGVSLCSARSGRYPGAQDPRGPERRGPTEMTWCVQGSGPPGWARGVGGIGLV